ncbi:PIR protein [Plasmodium vivax]|uniref:VIR protein n=1 Tax=Plasmodium vivax TaxID=5855 RepID=A0A565A5I2_PLAVI|nr:PIR protein [Plasmodium vivax]
MSPAESQNGYEFFQNMDHSSIYKAVKSVSDETRIEPSFLKSFINCDSHEITGNSLTVCKKLNILFKLLCSSVLCVRSNKCLNNSDYKYLNFWANYELNGKNFIDNGSIEYYKNHMNDEINGLHCKENMKAVLGEIEEEDLKKMKILDNLYQSYNEMNELIFSNSSEEISKCSGISTECVTQYNDAITEFGNTKDNFHNALMMFEHNYIKLHAKAVRKNKSFEKYIKKIPIEYKISELSFYSTEYETKKIIIISLLCSAFAIISILIYFYKFTPFGTRMCARKRNKKKKFPTRDDTNNTLQCFDAFNHANTNNKMYNLAYNSV